MNFLELVDMSHVQVLEPPLLSKQMAKIARSHELQVKVKSWDPQEKLQFSLGDKVHWNA